MPQRLAKLFERFREQDALADSSSTSVHAERRILRLEAALIVIVDALEKSGVDIDSLLRKMDREMRNAVALDVSAPAEVVATNETPYRGAGPQGMRDPSKEYCSRCGRELKGGESYSFTESGNVCPDCLRAKDVD